MKTFTKIIFSQPYNDIIYIFFMHFFMNCFNVNLSSFYLLKMPSSSIFLINFYFFTKLNKLTIIHNIQTHQFISITILLRKYRNGSAQKNN